jgi:hypothetical protein
VLVDNMVIILGEITIDDIIDRNSKMKWNLSLDEHMYIV